MKGAAKKCFRKLFDHDADVNKANRNNVTALMIACLKGNVDAVDVLLNAGADVNFADVNGDTCFMYAITGDCRKEILQTIIDHGADVDATDRHNVTLLVKACHKGNIGAINVLLNAGADPNAASADSETCLIYATSRCFCKEVLWAMIDHGANVNATNKNNETALMIACQVGTSDVINVLLNAGADPSTADENGDTLLHHAVYKNISKEILNIIIDHGANVNAVNDAGSTALLLACTKGQREAVNSLLTAGADTSIFDIHGDTCLHKVCHRECCQQTLHTLLNHGAPVNAQSQNHQTTYILAYAEGNID